MLGINSLVNNLNTAIAVTPVVDLKLIQMTASIDAVQNYSKSQIEELTATSASENKGRIVYANDRKQYVYSNGTNWNIDKDPDYLIYSWGGRDNGILGDGTTIGKSSPNPIPFLRNDRYIDIAGTEYGFAALTPDGVIETWGEGVNGKLGDNSTVNKSSPVRITAGTAQWIALAQGPVADHNFALRSNGTLWAWGFNQYGQLGDGLTINKASPVAVIGGITDWKQVVKGDIYSVALRHNQEIYAWGQASQNRTTHSVGRSSPTLIVGGALFWNKIACNGTAANMALDMNGNLYAWGAGSNGQLGDGFTISRASPVLIADGGIVWTDIVGTRSAFFAKATDGTLWAWGFNAAGQLGNNTTLNRSSPVQVAGGFSDWVDLSGNNAIAAIRSNGSLWTWGGNDSRGVLGIGSPNVNRSSPVQVSFVGKDKWTLVASTLYGCVGW